MLSFVCSIALSGGGRNAQLPEEGHFLVLLNMQENFNDPILHPV